MSFWSIALPGALAFVGSAAGNAVAWLIARRQAQWHEREETMRLLRWAADLAVGEQPRQIELGIAALDGLLDSPLVNPQDTGFIYHVVRAVRTGSNRDGRGPSDD